MKRRRRSTIEDQQDGKGLANTALQFLKDKKIPTCLKRKIMDDVIIPAMTYGAETWTLMKHQERKLAVAQRSMERYSTSQKTKFEIKR